MISLNRRSSETQQWLSAASEGENRRKKCDLHSGQNYFRGAHFLSCAKTNHRCSLQLTWTITSMSYRENQHSQSCACTIKMKDRDSRPSQSEWRTEPQRRRGGWGESGEAGVEWRKGQHFNMNSWEVVVLDVVHSSGSISNSEQRRGDNPTCWWSNRGLHTCFQSCIFLERSVGRRALLPYTCQQSSHLSALNNGVRNHSKSNLWSFEVWSSIFILLYISHDTQTLLSL